MIEGAYSLPVMETVKAAWAKVSGAKGTIWAVIGLFFLALLVVEIFASLIGHTVIILAFNFISWLIQVIAGASLIYLGIKRAQDMPIFYKMIKDILNTRTILSMIGFYLLQILILLPAAFIGAIGAYLAYPETDPSSMMRFISVLFYLAAAVWFIFLSVRLWLGFGAIVDKKLNPFDALKLSFKATQGNVLNLIGLYIINILIITVCVITLGIGFIWGLPWIFINYGEVYKRLSTRQDMRPIS